MYWNCLLVAFLVVFMNLTVKKVKYIRNAIQKMFHKLSIHSPFCILPRAVLNDDKSFVLNIHSHFTSIFVHMLVWPDSSLLLLSIFPSRSVFVLFYFIIFPILAAIMFKLCVFSTVLIVAVFGLEEEDYTVETYPNPRRGGWKECGLKSAGNVCDPYQVRWSFVGQAEVGAKLERVDYQ